MTQAVLGYGHSQIIRVRLNVGTAVAADLAHEQTFDIREPQMLWPAIGKELYGMSAAIIAAGYDDARGAQQSRISKGGSLV